MTYPPCVPARKLLPGDILPGGQLVVAIDGRDMETGAWVVHTILLGHSVPVRRQWPNGDTLVYVREFARF